MSRFHLVNRVGQFFVLCFLVFAMIGCGDRIAPPADQPANVRTEIAEVIARPRRRTLTGEYRARIQSDLSFRVGGRIASRNVDVGDRVEPGQILASLDTLQPVADVKAAQAALRSAEAAQQDALAEAERIEKLLESNSASQAEFDNAKAALLIAQGAVEVAKSTLANTESQLLFTDLQAESAGVIVARQAEVGLVVGPAETVFTIAEDGDREAVFDVFPTHIPERPVDDIISLKLVSNPNVKTEGTIREIAPSIDPASGTVRVKVAVPDPPSEMKLGASVVGEAQFRPMDVVQLPWTAMMRKGDQASVWVVDPQNQTVSQRVVEVESHQSGVMLVTQGLQPGEIVVVDGVQLLHPGQTVNPMQTPSDKSTLPTGTNP
ncbi:efflux RND transporter periplasmic adaptor subunit [Neorhodopirellula pilleata]|uniref:Efflux pump periplasmic linker BepF n=1 Tax=Neorhodopirellula pilleata TaxID=2714738 RepID=A0A5C5ZFJ9_9BACT|nr:efflux RND transporter periplasmic adaptor subunit [Neorhodopirellula pilleata]TWT86102.1 Efflux pump periplasmic linker BepF [Neorhodopirellula pilleata]